MGCKRVIACMDVMEGRTVKGVRFQNLKDLGDPAEQGYCYQEQGADEIVVLDITASRERRKTDLGWIKATADRLSIPLSAGGGIRNLDDASALLDAGSDKVTVNTAAVRSPGLITAIADRYGSQCCVVAVDARRTESSWTVLVDGGHTDTGMDVLHWISMACEAGCGEILLTSWDRDGTSLGYDIPLTRAVSRASQVPIIASGGAGRKEHFTEVFTHGNADAALAAGILHRGICSITHIKEELILNEIEVRPCWYPA